MSLRPEKNFTSLQLAAIIDVLGIKLSDGDLLLMFPELKPSFVRKCLKEAATILQTGSQEKPATKLNDKSLSPVRKQIDKKENFYLFTDGAARGNPGEAGAGFSIQDQQADEIYAGCYYLGNCTNNVAEYKALLLGLTEVLNLGVKKVVCHLDSELIVKQIEGAYKVKNEKLKPLFFAVKKLLDQFESYKVTHVRREKNKRADQLANRAIDEKSTKKEP